MDLVNLVQTKGHGVDDNDSKRRIGNDEAITSINPILLPFNGKCGTQRNTCLAGELDDEAVADTNTHYQWHCKRANEGTTAQDCTAAISSHP